jgi:hypothetical protein
MTEAPATAEALMQIIDVLWGELPADVVIRLAGEHPEIVDACRLIHEHVAHESGEGRRSRFVFGDEL